MKALLTILACVSLTGCSLLGGGSPLVKTLTTTLLPNGQQQTTTTTAPYETPFQKAMGEFATTIAHP